MKPSNFAYYITKYFSKYLPGQLGASTNTIKSYRDTFSLFLKFVKSENDIPIDKINLETCTKKLVEDFLNWLEMERKSSISTRNQRLSALQAFFRYLQIECPEYMYIYQQILSIPKKRYTKASFDYLPLEGIKTILSLPNVDNLKGRRDFTLICLLYDTGARVQEIIDCKVSDIRLLDPATIRLIGKGKKARIVPLMSKTSLYIEQYINENRLNEPHKSSHNLFVNRMKQKLTRSGVNYILRKYVDKARLLKPEQIPKKVTAHTLRHSKAMHLLQAGVNLVYIRDLLGHADIKTTEIYARADSNMKRKALENAYNDLEPKKLEVQWKEDHELLTWLQNLCQSDNNM